MIYVQDADFTLYQGDCLDVLRSLPTSSVHCCVTSPPYWGLRDYGTGTWDGGDPGCDHRHDTQHQKQGSTSARAGRSNAEDQRNENFRDVCGKCGATRVDRQLGLEQTPDEYVARMVEVFREVRRVLRDDGSLWLNIGDSYGGERTTGRNDTDRETPGGRGGSFRDSTRTFVGRLKPKDLVGIPWRLAFALQADGWWLRSDIIWAKPNPMPESVTDRPTKAHEYVFLLTKSARYYWDAEAVREPAKWFGPNGAPKKGPHSGQMVARSGRNGHDNGELSRNVRSVWEIATQPYAEAHFATFPLELPRRCIAAGTSERGCCPECGAPWEREIERKFYGNLRTSDNLDGHRDLEVGISRNNFGGQKKNAEYVPPKTLGWRPTCGHAHEPVPCTVLDPFAGSGTTNLVARNLGRRSIGIELSPDYCELAARQMQQLSLLAEEVG